MDSEPTYGPDFPGKAAFDLVLAHMRAGPMGGSDEMLKCPGFVRWSAYLRREPKSTLADFLVQFEKQANTDRSNAWAFSLLEVFKDVYPEFRDRVVATLGKDGAHFVRLNPERFNLTDEHVEFLIDKHGAEPASLGVVAPPSARRAGKPIE